MKPHETCKTDKSDGLVHPSPLSERYTDFLKNALLVHKLTEVKTTHDSFPSAFVFYEGRC